MNEEKSNLIDMSVREKGLWAELIATIAVLLYYVPNVFSLMNIGDEALGSKAMIELIVKTVLLAILVASVLAIIFQPKDKPEAMDERDNAFMQGSEVWGNRFLVAFLLMIIGVTITKDLLPGVNLPFLGFELTPLIMANMIMLSLMASSFLKSIMLLCSYRRGY